MILKIQVVKLNLAFQKDTIPMKILKIYWFSERVL